jgi:hypothetical protein
MMWEVYFTLIMTYKVVVRCAFYLVLSYFDFIAITHLYYSSMFISVIVP